MITFICPNIFCLFLGIVLWCPSLADDDTLLNICLGHHLSMVTRGKGMQVFLLTNQSISLVKSTMADIM